MRINSQYFYNIFVRSIADYHIFDDIDQPLNNPYPEEDIDNIAYRKNWIDTVQWHLEDMVRDPDIDCSYALSIKRRIDDLNQKRTDAVELIDDYFQNKYGNIAHERDAKHNTESLGWAIDRLSILSLKEFHLHVELRRSDASLQHINNCLNREKILTSQMNDLLQSINWLIEDIQFGKKENKVYRQLKMYNDQSFNPVLYNKQKQR